MAVWKSLHNIVARISIIVVGISAITILLGTLTGTVDIVGTRIFNSPLPAAVELTQAFMVLIIFGSFAYTQIQKSHIRVTFFYERMGTRTRMAFDLLNSLICTVFFAVFTWQVILLARNSWRTMELVQGLVNFPVYPVKTIAAIGVGMMAIQLVLELIDNSINFIRKTP